MMRSTLGMVLGVLLRAHEELTTDPMNDHVGYHPDPEPQLRKIAARLGWEFSDIHRALKDRGVSDRWVYASGLWSILGSEDEPESRIIKDRDGGYFVVWHGQSCTPHFNSMGAAEAYRDMLKRGQRSPEYPS